MVAPLVIAGLGAVGGMAIGAVANILSGKKVYAIVWMRGGRIEAKSFPDQASAERFQKLSSGAGRATILIEKSGESLTPIRAVAAGGRQVDVKALRNSKMGVGSRDFDTTAEQEEMMDLTTRVPTPASAIRAQKGPFPDTNPGRQDTMPESPLFRGTTSSHEWETEVNTWEVPDKFFPGRDGQGGQPEELVVEQALQFPEDQENQGA